MLSDYGEGDQAHIKSELGKCIWLTYYKTTGATRIRRDASKGMALMKSTIHINQLINILIKATVSNLKLQKKVPSKVSTSAHSHTLISLKGWFHGGSVATGQFRRWASSGHVLVAWQNGWIICCGNFPLPILGKRKIIQSFRGINADFQVFGFVFHNECPAGNCTSGLTRLTPNWSAEPWISGHGRSPSASKDEVPLGRNGILPWGCALRVLSYALPLSGVQLTRLTSG